MRPDSEPGKEIKPIPYLSQTFYSNPYLEILAMDHFLKPINFISLFLWIFLLSQILVLYYSVQFSLNFFLRNPSY